MIVEDSVGLELDGVTLVNSPQFHCKFEAVRNVHVHDMTIFVDVWKQKALLQSYGHWHPEFDFPTFPLNTDGIDPSGQNVTIERVSITNFDDAVAVKPSNAGKSSGDCSQDMIIRDSTVSYGVGMTIGSVPPNAGVNCVRNITFDNIEFHSPIKAIYIKSNPGTVGTGIIEGITYSNIVAHTPLWYPLWIGPQQQQQPGTKGTGCSFLYPIVKTCPTQPRVTIRDITLSNVTFTGGLTLPGVLLANASNPYTNIVFDNVNNTGLFLVQKDYVCEHVSVTSTGGTAPAPSCSA
uniref:Endo-polygalacturonase n=1 Tax=Bicosoecida sp. CB-2014 TaxID=1486930 RepID=A0A7S1GE72_9STRA|mmetsp:Transcript_7108/g.25321  ORF Transcript_7108/g.25321 Transcript_7108/m.25321 type:complete len:292 (+) Transcript_7108:461-1336(+)